MDYPQDGSRQSEPELLRVTEDDFVEVVSATPAATTRLLFIENINTQLISFLGEILDVDPIFFADHVNTNFEDIENAPPPPSLAMLPSIISKRGHLHLHYQQVLDLGGADIFANTKYALKTDSNIPRNIRRLAPLSGRQLALARMCCSLLVKNIGRSCICVILVDRPVTSVVEELSAGGRKAYQAKPLHGGFEDFGPSQSFSSFTRNKDNETWDKDSMFGSLLHYFQTQTPPGFQASSPSILGLGYYPIRIVLAEWNLYMHLISRYSKYYEYSIQDITNRLHDNDIIDLQRWRRRSKQSRHKLTILAEFVDYWMQHEDDKETWNLVLKDINYLQQQLQCYNQSLEQMVAMATSMVQLLDSRRSILEAINVRRLTS
ncbi:hypothetical protein CEP51_010757 [Fusarium floridanum]|uniref:Uncharacterized protein n=1 Tax=Fusarium floridanum TaxID=1325733 RepID=A0A428RDF7_9HYPO|nr:hypothetical protein CEP51_010757 [Fusarium floridanum]